MQARSPASTVLQKVLILAILAALILVPRPLAGFLDLKAARSFEASGNDAGAATAYFFAAQRIPWQPSLWEKAGLAAYRSGEVERAFDLLSKAGERDALSSAGWLALGDSYWQRGESSPAVDAWERALPSADAYRRLVRVRLANGDLSAAIHDSRALLALVPEDASVHYQLGLLLAATTYEDALPELLKAASLDSRFDPAVETLRTALNLASIESNPSRAMVIIGRGLGLVEEWSLSIESFRQAIMLDSGNADAWAWLGEAKQHLDRDGSVELQKAVALAPNSATVQALYGLYWQRQGQPQKALMAFLKAVEIEPEDSGWQVALAGAYAQSGDLVSALEHYRRAVELAPRDALAWRALAVFSISNEADIAGTGFPAAQKLLALAPNDWLSRDVAGQTTFALGNLRDAERQFLKAIELSPEQPGPHLHLGWVYLETGDREAAYAQISQARDLDPDGLTGQLASRLLDQYFP